MNWSILPILAPFAATSALAWAALWLVDRLCERSGPKFDPVAWIARDLGRVISEEFDRRCVHGDGPSGAPPSEPAYSFYRDGLMTRDEVRESMGLPPLEDVRREKPEWFRR